MGIRRTRRVRLRRPQWGARRRREAARYLLAIIRLANGGVGLFAPRLFITRFDPGREPSPAAVYAFRLFGIRTILIGLDLLRGPERAQAAARDGVVIHASDAITAASLGLSGAVPRRTAGATTLISVLNVLLALAAQEPLRPGRIGAGDSRLSTITEVVAGTRDGGRGRSQWRMARRSGR
jgi:hypothetical protein